MKHAHLLLGMLLLAGLSGATPAQAGYQCPFESRGQPLDYETFVGTSPCGGGTGSYWTGGNWNDYIVVRHPVNSNCDWKVEVRLHYCDWVDDTDPPCPVSPDHNQFNLDGQHCATSTTGCGDLWQPADCSPACKWNIAKFCNADGFSRTDQDLIEIKVVHMAGTYQAVEGQIRSSIWSAFANGSLTTTSLPTGTDWRRLIHASWSSSNCGIPNCPTACR